MTENLDLYVVEMQTENGHRYWSRPMFLFEVDEYITKMESFGDELSDIDLAYIPTRYYCPNSLMAAVGWEDN